ncbi:hypothetical protein G6F58_013169 [Rhizopus delemar]|nr:hypothetical protein G6F58_013169 [Rhizopus delemar]
MPPWRRRRASMWWHPAHWSADVACAAPDPAVAAAAPPSAAGGRADVGRRAGHQPAHAVPRYRDPARAGCRPARGSRHRLPAGAERYPAADDPATGRDRRAGAGPALGRGPYRTRVGRGCTRCPGAYRPCVARSTARGIA